MTRPIRILLVDDHTLLRETLRDRLTDEPDLSVVAVAANADEAVTRAVEHHPDVIVMDIDMPGLECFDAARIIRSRCPDTRLVFLSAHTHDRYIAAAIAVGALGYLTKGEPVERVIQAIRTIATGESFFSPAVIERLVITPTGTRLAEANTSRASTLSPRELEVLHYVARGLTQQEIAETMHLSAKTVNAHCMNLMNKLDIHDRVQLTRFAIREGLIDA